MSDQEDITAAIVGLRSRLDMLASIEASNLLIPGGPEARYHQIIEEAYVVLGLIETQIDELRTALEYQHRRLDDMRDVALAKATQKKEFSIDAEDVSRRAHEDWANDE